jgi:cytochrome P450
VSFLVLCPSFVRTPKHRTEVFTRRKSCPKCIKKPVEQSCHSHVSRLTFHNRFAGVDSTAATIRTIFYHLMKSPEALRKTQNEIDSAFADGTLSHPIQYNKAIKLPYLQAVIKEAARIYPAWQVPMPRVSPSQGLELSGIHIPGGYIVGMSPACVQRNKRVFGQDSDVFRPERWLESEERTRSMDRAMLNFGAGTRTCIGKHVSLRAVRHNERY